MWLSLIIPVHNAEKYLRRCVDSILESGEKLGPSFEILLINNNSTDQSVEIAKEYEKKHPGLIKYFTQKIPGAAATRNYGARKASGEYIWFVDADDYIDGSALSELKMVREFAPDLISFDVAKLDRDGKEVRKLSAIDPKDPYHRSRFVRYGLGPWQLVIRRKFWMKNGFTFPEKMIHEDMALMSVLILYTDKLAAVPKVLYYYCDNPESVLHKSEFDPHIFDIFPALSMLELRFEKKGAARHYAAELEWFCIWNLLIDSAKDFRAFPEGKRGIKETRKFLKFHYPRWRKNKFLREKPLKLRVRVWLNYLGV